MPPCPVRILSDAAVRQYHADGYYLARGFFDAEEIDLLKRSAKEDNELDQRSFGRADGEGGVVRLSLWNHPGDGIYGMFARCERMVRSCEKLLGGEVYHYHSKMILKDAKVGGAWAWHQDYGYWYQNGVLTPDLTSVFIAVDPCTKENGCLQVIRELAPLRADQPRPHRRSGRRGPRTRRGDPEAARTHSRSCTSRWTRATPSSSTRTCCTARDQNKSDNPRWAMICCYNARANDPYKESHHPRYTPLKRGAGCGDQAGRREAVRRLRRRGVARRCSRFQREEPASKRHKTRVKNNSGHFCLVLPVPAF